MSSTIQSFTRYSVVVGALVAAAVFKCATPSLAKLIHLFAFMSWFGTSIWVSFFSGLIAFKTLQRHTFGRLQSRIFPIYFAYSCHLLMLCISCALCEKMLTNGSSKTTDNWKVQYLLGSLLLTLVNFYFLEPWTTALMWKRHATEKRLNTGHEIGKLCPDDPNHVANKSKELKDISRKFGTLQYVILFIL